MSGPVAAAARGRGVRLRDATFADLTTLRVGGRPRAVLECSDADALAGTVGILDAAAVPTLIVGGGSNLVVGEDVADLVAVVPVTGEPPQIVAGGTGGDAGGAVGGVTGGVVVRAFAGTVWDDLVAWSVARGFGGLECLSGVPGTVGAAPVQNIGAYGAEVSGVLHRVQLLERPASRGERTPHWVAPESLDLAYRYSNLKFTARAVVTAVEFRLTTDGLSVPLRFGELARRLGAGREEVEPRRPVQDVRDTVLDLRRGKGMVLSETDHDTWSAGSFFTNPVVVGEEARRQVVARVTSQCGAAAAAAMPCYPVAVPPGDAGNGGDAGDGASAVKLSAAWLIEQAGFPKGWSVDGDSDGRASLSTRHTLALTNRGGASSADIIDLATAVRDGVRDAFGVTLVPEPVWIGASLSD